MSESPPIKVLGDCYNLLLQSVLTHTLDTAGGNPHLAHSLALMVAERLRSRNHIGLLDNVLHLREQDKQQEGGEA
jgi:hypothetical protein